jgi:2,3-bisphosphoglycerate-independent phosphoglycerate mutase
MKNKPLALIILDGFGINPNSEGNAVLAARKPNIDSYMAKYPHSLIRTSGMDVGLPEGQMGNSEVGHTNIGAGRIVYQDLTRITMSINEGSFFEKKEFLAAIENCKRNGTKLHIMGLLSDGGVHSHNTHLYALIYLAKMHGLDQVFVHCFLDGRDVPPDSGLNYVEELEEKLKSAGTGKIATVMGRYYAMDRDNRWERVRMAYDAMVSGTGRFAPSAGQAVKEAYEANEYDEFVKPVVITETGKPTATIGAKDSVIFFNFRPDRARKRNSAGLKGPLAASRCITFA